MKVSGYVLQEDEEIEVATDLVTKEVRRKKVVDVVSLQQALEISIDLNVPVEVLLKKSTGEAAHKVVELTEGIQDLVVAGDLLNIAEESQRKDVACLGAGTSEADASEADASEADASEAIRGNTYSHDTSDSIVEIKSTSTSTSSNIDNIPLNKVYENLHKSFAPSPSTKHQKKSAENVFEPMYPTVLERIGELAQRRIVVC